MLVTNNNKLKMIINKIIIMTHNFNNKILIIKPIKSNRIQSSAQLNKQIMMILMKKLEKNGKKEKKLIRKMIYKNN